jgi:hypothetical protein
LQAVQQEPLPLDPFNDKNYPVLKKFEIVAAIAGIQTYET